MSAIMERSHNRSFFWPLLLIGIGVIWLLGNVGILSSANFNMLFRLWPLVLIGIGLQLLVGRGRPGLGTLIGVGGVAVIILAMLVGPSLGWVSAGEVKQAQYTENLGDAQSARIIISPAIADTTINALSNTDMLFDADLAYIGTVDYDVQGGTDRVIKLEQRSENQGFSLDRLFNFGLGATDQDLNWQIGLSPNLPLDLNVNGGIGSSVFNLSDLNLTHLEVNSGVGDITLSLPALDGSYEVVLNGGAGAMHIQVEEGAAVDFAINGGVGEVNIDLPGDAPVRIDATTGVGQIDLPAGFEQISGDEDSFVGDEGVWQTANYEAAGSRITIQYNGGVGSLIVR